MSKNILEKELTETYVQMLASLPTGFSVKKARKEIIKIIKALKKEAKTEGLNSFRDDYGDIMFELAKNGVAEMKSRIDEARNEGATDEDIREYWNLPDLQRRIVIWFENVFRFSQFLADKDDGLSADEAGIRMRKMFPIYGNPKELKECYESHNDVPLPNELRARVDVYREKHHPEELQKKASKFTSFNAFVRAEIRRGNI